MQIILFYFHIMCFSFSALLLNSVMSAFKPEFIAKRALELVEIMKECDDSGFPKVIYDLLFMLIIFYT